MVVVQYYVLYGISQFSQTSMAVMGMPYVPRQESVDTAMLLAVGACLVFVGATAWARRLPGRGGKKRWFAFPEPNSRWQVPVAVYATVSAAFGYFKLMSPETIPVVMRNVATVGLNPHLGFALVLYCAYRYRLLRMWVLAILMILSFVLLTAMSSMLEPVIVAIYIVFVAAWLWGPGIRLRWGIAAVCLFLVLNPAKYELRQGNLGRTATGGLPEQLTDWQSSLGNVWTTEGDIADTAELATARLSGIIALAQGVEWIPAIVPYQHGAGFGTALQFFVPRLLWPDKPGITDLLNNRYALAFGLSTEEGLQTATFGILQPLDGYWDFGIVGALAYSVAFGLLIGWAFRERAGTTVSESMVALIFSSWFFQSLAALQFVLASLASLFVGTWVVLKILEFLGERLLRRSGDSPESEPACLGI